MLSACPQKLSQAVTQNSGKLPALLPAGPVRALDAPAKLLPLLSCPAAAGLCHTCRMSLPWLT